MKKKNRKHSDFFKWLLPIYLIFSFAFGLYYAWEQSAKLVDAPFKSVMFSKDYLLIGAEEVLPGDAAGYNLMAVTLLETGAFRDAWGNYSANYVAGFPLFLSIVYSLFGYGLWAVIFVNSVMATLNLYLIYYICYLVLNEKAAWIALLLQASNVRFLYHVGGVNYYSLLIFLMLLSLYICIRLSNDQSSIFCYLFLGGVLGAAMLVRPIFAPVAGILLAYLALQKRRITYVIISFLIASIPLLSWVGRNYLRFGVITDALRTPITFLEGNNDAYKNITIVETYYLPKIRLSEEQMQLMKKYNKSFSHLPPEVNSYYITRLINKHWIKQNIRIYLKNIVWRVKGILSPFTRNMSFRNKFFSTVFWVIIIIPGVVGLIFMPSSKFKIAFIFSCFFLVIIPPLVVLDRYLHYQIPFQVFVTIPAALSYEKFFSSLKKSTH